MDKSLETAEDIYGEGKSKVKQGYEKAQNKVDEWIKETQSRAARSWEEVRDFCREHPAQAIGISLAAGALVGLALSKALGRQDSPAEKKIKEVFRTGHESWDQVKNGIEQTVSGLKGAIETFR